MAGLHGPQCERRPESAGLSREEAKRLIRDWLQPQAWQQFIKDALEAARTSQSSSGRLKVDLRYPNLSKLHDSPPIYVVDGFLSDAECVALIALAPPLLAPSKTSDKVVEEVRTSTTGFLERSSAASCAIFERIRKLTGKTHEFQEDVQASDCPMRTSLAPTLDVCISPLLRLPGTSPASIIGATSMGHPQRIQMRCNSLRVVGSGWPLF